MVQIRKVERITWDWTWKETRLGHEDQEMGCVVHVRDDDLGRLLDKEGIVGSGYSEVRQRRARLLGEWKKSRKPQGVKSERLEYVRKGIIEDIVRDKKSMTIELVDPMVQGQGEGGKGRKKEVITDLETTWKKWREGGKWFKANEEDDVSHLTAEGRTE